MTIATLGRKVVNCSNPSSRPIPLRQYEHVYPRTQLRCRRLCNPEPEYTNATGGTSYCGDKRPVPIMAKLKTLNPSTPSSMPSLRFCQAVLLGAELCVCVAAVTLFGIQYASNVRLRLWENGGVEGWNSNPNLRIYFYANYKEPPEIPLIDSTLAIAILSLVILVVRALTVPFRYLPRYANIGYDLLLCSLWITSTIIQNSGDWSDPKHISKHPWYLMKGCDVAWDTNRGICRTAKTSFFVSILSAALYGARLLFGIVKIGYEMGQEQLRKDEGLVDEYSHEGMELLSVDELERIQQQAFSPVLAFFPESHRDR